MRLRYDAEADGYDELYSDEQRTKYELAFRSIVFCGADRILDCGCGTGIFLEKVAGTVTTALDAERFTRLLEYLQDKIPFLIATALNPQKSKLL